MVREEEFLKMVLDMEKTESQRNIEAKKAALPIIRILSLLLIIPFVVFPLFLRVLYKNQLT